MPIDQLHVYDDGRCAFCQWAQKTIAGWDREHRLEFRDYNDPAVAAETPFTFEQLHQRMHVQAPDGRWHKGFFAWIAILRVLPGWRWVAAAMRLPPLRWIGPTVYEFIANHRYQIPAWLLRRLGAPPACDKACFSSAVIDRRLRIPGPGGAGARRQQLRRKTGV
jgi:predicted DCC family thiol-disulfide oxidoreductase YuxK